MTTLVHRRRLRQAVREPKGPGGTIGPIVARYTWPLTWIGWLSILACVPFLVWRVPQTLDHGSGTPDGIDWLGLLSNWPGLLSVLGDAALVLMPAALELGFPGVARRNRWLLIGAALVALYRFGDAAIGPLFGWAWSAVVEPDASVQGTVFQVLILCLATVSVGGWLALTRGLWLAGARPTRRVLAVYFAALVVFEALLLPLNPGIEDWGSVSVVDLALFGIGTVLRILSSAASVAVVFLLIWGATARLVPRRAWWIGAIAAAVYATSVVFGIVVLFAQSSELAPISTMSWLGAAAAWPMLLLVACLAGLGRGTETRRSRRRHRYVVHSEQRLRGESFAFAEFGPLGAQPSESR